MALDEYAIRRATLDDAAALARVHEATWRETYTGLMSEQMLDALTADARTDAWRRILSGKAGYLATTYVAEAGSELVAFASCGEQRNADFAAQGYAGEFAAVYVLNTAQRCGVGGRLMRAIWTISPVAGHRIRPSGSRARTSLPGPSMKSSAEN